MGECKDRLPRLKISTPPKTCLDQVERKCGDAVGDARGRGAIALQRTPTRMMNKKKQGMGCEYDLRT